MKVHFAPTKSPWNKGRIGPREDQDWFVALDAIATAFQAGDSVVVTSKNQLYGMETSEVVLYKKVLKELGIPEEAIEVNAKGMETIAHVQAALESSAKLGARTMVIYAREPFLSRVVWIARRSTSSIAILRHETFGVPRARENKTDWVLRFLYPVIDLLGHKKRFQKLVNKRRKAGKL